MAEAKMNVDPRSRLSIYDSPSQPIVLVAEPPSALQLQVSSLRRTSEHLYQGARSRLREVSNEWVGTERKVESQVKSILAPDEDLTPGGLYVGVSTLLGSIVSRNRSFPLRFLSPPIFFLASASYFLPKTASNANLYLRELERAHAPALYDAHTAASRKVSELVDSAKEAYGRSTNAAVQLSRDGRQTIERSSGLGLQTAGKLDRDRDDRSV